MSLLSVSSILPPPRLGTFSSCFQLLTLSSSPSIISVAHFRAQRNYIPHSTHIPDSHLKLQRLLTENKSGFKNLDNALSLFRKMLKMQPLPCHFHFCQLLTTLVKMKQYQVAFSLFREMCTLSIPVSIITFNIAINCCCHSNRVDYAFSLLATTFKRGFVPNVVTYNTLIRGLLSQHKFAEARLFFANLIKFRQVQPNVVTFTTMIDGLCKTGHTDMALSLFRFMEKSDCEPNTVTYNAIVNSLCKRGLVDDALNLHSRMMDEGIFPDVWTYSPIIQVLCSLKRWEEVGLLLDQMIHDMKISPDVHTFTILVDAYSKSGKLDDAKHLIQIMNERGENPDIVTYTSLMQGYCSQGQMDEALAMLNTIRSKKIMPTCYTYSILNNSIYNLELT
ncbi:putative pentatricopeptide repeat-containing protein, mitochondrial [Heracleum sosnowskyi]|uniref:Pentatricopeptide repeat-containing protein, mitochondrial n=1 Tax=Heracleum sosnowskyi TaxID=360622 RepID=A0AAD8ILC9_9APIA|nr:putative pentatricopeptide repeat-containing protein, mitochondrial [Heracleum sosnowskyi]